jgi:hypothetical protein
MYVQISLVFLHMVGVFVHCCYVFVVNMFE